VTNGRRPALHPDDRPEPLEGPLADAKGDARPALSPAQLAFLALIAALILTALRRLRRASS
jgi:hypothetical protein